MPVCVGNISPNTCTNRVNSRRHLKCDERRPICGRCSRARLVCDLPFAKETPIAHKLVLLQPSTALHPHQVQPEAYEIDLFGYFRSTLVRNVSGPFNQTFWRIDVPSAAQAYPALWHATIALTAILQNTRATAQVSGPLRGHHYILALKHFNKSIRHLLEALTAARSNMSYADKEMIIMTNFIYIGICSMFRDPTLINSHYKNLIDIIEQLRFGEEDPKTRRGIMSYDGLMCVILTLEGDMDSHEHLVDRWERPWIVKTPKHYSFATMEQAYQSFLPLVFAGLLDKDEVRDYGYYGPTRYLARQRMLKAYKLKLDDFELSGGVISDIDREAMNAIRLLYKVLHMKEVMLAQKSRQDRMQHELKYDAVLDEINVMLSRASLNSEGYHSPEVPSIVYAPAVGSAIIAVLESLTNSNIRQKCVHVMLKWPLKETSICNDVRALFYTAIMEHERTGPERTRASQHAGNAVIPTFPNGSLPEGEFDGCAGCECITGEFTCRDHKLGQLVFINTSIPLSVGLRTWYEVRHDWPLTYYPLQY